MEPLRFVMMAIEVCSAGASGDALVVCFFLTCYVITDVAHNPFHCCA